MEQNEAEIYAKGLAAMAELGELGHLEPDYAYDMIDTVSKDEAVMSRRFPGLDRDALFAAYEEAVRGLVAADSFQVEARSKDRSRRVARDYMSSATGIPADRVSALLDGDVRTPSDLDDVERINNM